MIFTFYSYKGGVGRSMAMAGIAHLLARRGLRVLAIDFDLEAPGLERYFFDGERCKAVRAQRGLLDLIRAYREALASETAFAAGEFKRWQNYRLTAIHTAGTLGGSVDLMTAGQREPDTAMRDYALAVRSFDWQDFFHNWKGDLFFDWLRRQFGDASGGYDVVLVDSRTGVTEMGGVCAYQLADAAVLLCAPNYQNLEGTRDVARDFRSEGVRALRQGRPLEILAVPARLEPNHPKRAEFLAKFRAELGVEGLPAVLAAAGLDYEKLALPYLPQFAVAERLVGDPQADAGETPPIEVFERLADALTLLAPPDTALGRQHEAALLRLSGGRQTDTLELLTDTTLSSAGYDAFLDHSRGDRALVGELVSALEGAGFRAIAGCAESESGDRLLGAYDQALDYSQSLLVCFGQPTHTEARSRLIARARRLQNVAVVPVLLPGADPRALASFDLALEQAIDLREWPAEGAQQRLREALAAAVQPGAALERAAAATAGALEREPYPGGRPHAEDDAAFFFGREDEAAELRKLLAEHDLVLLVGPPQVGKTSLVQAGLLPSLRAGGDTALRVADMVWLDFGDPQQPELATRLADREVVGGLPQGTSDPRLVICDGFDSFPAGREQEALAERLGWLARVLGQGRPRIKFLILARDVVSSHRLIDFVEPASGLGASWMNLAPLDGSALRRAIDEPARRAGHLLEPGLAERLIEAAGGARSAIAQIQRALATIWPERRRGWLTNQSLDAAGQLGGIEKRHRQAVLATLDKAQRRAARALAGRLVSLSTTYELVPAAQRWDLVATVPAVAAVDAEALRDRLAGAGLVDLARVPYQSDNDERPEFAVQIALARPDAAEFLADLGGAVELRFLLWREPLAIQAAHWAGRHEEALLRGAALVEAQDWLARAREQLSAHEAAFIEASVAALEHRQAADHGRELAEQAQREARERERREAAEALATEQAGRAQAEAAAAKLAQQDAARLRRGRRWLIGLLVLSSTLLVVALAQTLAEREARRAEARAKDSAVDDSQRARAALQSAEVAARTATEEGEKTRAALAYAEAARRAAEAALVARDAATRRSAGEQLKEAEAKYLNVQGKLGGAAPACPVGRRLYLHIADDADREIARRLIPLLEKQGFIVPGIERVTRPPPVNDVRYFRSNDGEQAAAQDVARALRGVGIGGVQVKFIAGYENSTSIRPCHYEAWFVPGALAASPMANK